MITVSDLRKVYRQGSNDVVALDGVSLEVPTGKIHGIVGHSGAGKSTLVRCLTLLDQPTSGSVAVNGKELTNVDSDALRNARRRIGMVFQHANLFDSRTTEQNVAYPLELVGTPKKEIAEKVAQLLELVGLTKFAKGYPSQLSGGQRQRVGIARALATDPDVLLCDEPTSALDPATTDEILELVRKLRDRLNITVLIITHEMHVVKQICDSVSLLEAGKIVEHGDLEAVITNASGRLASTLLPLPGEAPQAEGAGRVLDLLYTGAQATEPVISGIARKFNTDVNVLAGSVEHLGDQQFAHLRVQFAPDVDIAAIIEHLESTGIAVTVKEAK
ncbi:methionine ABC transporter ATP-binding protein [Arthrobacter sp. MYb224]|uniref:methionine ABC transporter ATP-binding protein n=1 Tax=unclassified Arthrobacter TaxID=235627 RepID=UPI000CFB6A22|nr:MULTISPECIES: ATP-binding cassette domain-containing protein [unclassified Arthrobacter]PQZ99244.1 methionine ABC transporter ATP-binding protein [Arthrobacter sp. MYb224]PRA06274.1 methionine ABC transporter ATP-binding protein [Arthrobacter sp. MYb229]PRB53176.1 methionine ABC transporter ATP-binding protein [Arthrobacter sp. MYb216]